MFTPYIDLHCHTNRSDGVLSHQQLVDEARACGIYVLGISDHNYTENLADLRAANPDMLLLQSAEFSCRYFDSANLDHELHVIGVGIDPNNKLIKEVLSKNEPDRRPYVDQILYRLRQLGIDIGTYDDLKARFPDTHQIGRMQIAKVMTELKYVNNVDAAFDKYIGAFGERLAYVENPLQYASLEDVVAAILDAGGVPILCHLHYYWLDEKENHRLVKHFKDLAGDKAAMEVYYSRYSTSERYTLLQLCMEYGLMISAGSDYHGQAEWETLDNKFSYTVCRDILECLGVTVPKAVPPSPILVLSGFSGAGKGTISKEIIKTKKTAGGKKVSIIVSVTTRAPRSPDDNYIFVSPTEFKDMISMNLLFEHNSSYAKNGYGTPISGLRKAIEEGALPCLEIDRIGLTGLLLDGRINPRLIRSVFVVAPAEDIYNRLVGRGTESCEAIIDRLETAVAEAYYTRLYNAVVVNNDLSLAVDQVLSAFDGNTVQCEFDIETFCHEMSKIVEKLKNHTFE